MNNVVLINPDGPIGLPVGRAEIDILASGAIPDGAYDVKRDAEGTWIRGAEGASGAAFIRFAYADRKLPDALRGTRLAEVSEPVDRALHVANVPGQPGTVNGPRGVTTCRRRSVSCRPANARWSS